MGLIAEHIRTSKMDDACLRMSKTDGRSANFVATMSDKKLVG